MIVIDSYHRDTGLEFGDTYRFCISVDGMATKWSIKAKNCETNGEYDAVKAQAVLDAAHVRILKGAKRVHLDEDDKIMVRPGFRGGKVEADQVVVHSPKTPKDKQEAKDRIKAVLDVPVGGEKDLGELCICLGFLAKD